MDRIRIKDIFEIYKTGSVVITLEPISLLSNPDIKLRDDYAYHYEPDFHFILTNTVFVVSNVYAIKEPGTYNNLLVYSREGIEQTPLHKLNIVLYHMEKNIKLMYGIYFETYDDLVSCPLQIL